MKTKRSLTSLAASAAVAAAIFAAQSLSLQQAYAGEFAKKTAPTTATMGLRVHPEALELKSLGMGSIKTVTFNPLTSVANNVQTAPMAQALKPAAMDAFTTVNALSAAPVLQQAISSEGGRQATAMTAMETLAPGQTAATPQATHQTAVESGALVFDGMKTSKSLEVSPSVSVSGVGVSGGKTLSRRTGGRILGKIAAAAAVFTPGVAFAADGAAAAQPESVSGWVIGAGVAAVAAVTAVTARVFKNVARTLDARPTSEEVDAYVKASKVLEFDRYKETSFNGDRLPGPGVREAFDAEISKMTGKSAKDSVAEALEIRSNFHARYAAYRHPVIAAIVRAFRKPGDGPNSGVPSDVKDRHEAARKRRNQLVRLMGMASVRGRDLPFPPEEFARISAELNQHNATLKEIEAQYPILAMSSPGMKAVGATLAVGASAGALYILGLISPLAALIVGALGYLAFNIRLYANMTPEQQKQMGEMARNMSMYK